MTTAPPTARPAAFVPDGSRAAGPPAPAAADRLPRVRRQRRPALAAGGALLVVLCGVASAALAVSGDDRVPVLALARDVQAGQVLSAQDLRVAELAGTGLSALSADGAAALVGQIVTASLPAGTLLNDSMLSREPIPAGGLQLVAVAVKPGGAPAEAAPGRDVSLVRVVTTANPQAGAEPQVLVRRARVVSVQTEATNGLLILTVQVPDGSAVAVAQASAAGAVAVTLLPVTP
jgi:hypothetical protein